MRLLILMIALGLSACATASATGGLAMVHCENGRVIVARGGDAVARAGTAPAVSRGSDVTLDCRATASD